MGGRVACGWWDVSSATAVNWAMGKHEPRRCDKERIARAMGIELETLFPPKDLQE